MILLVTYDLKQGVASYEPLFEALKSRESWAHYMPSTWLIATDQSPEALRDDLLPLIFEGDRFLVVKLEKPYSGWLPRKAWDWIKRHRED